MINVGFIDYYLDEWHANNYPAMLQKASGGELAVTLAYGQIASPITGMTSDEWCAKHGIAKAASVEELVGKSDAVIVLSPDNCEMHEGLCQLPLRSGKPCYVDKTFAPDYPTARRIFDIAEKSGTPCYSTSALRFASEYQVEPGSVRSIRSWGPNGFETYGIHQLEPIMMMIQSKPQKVMYMPGEGCYSLLIVFEGGRQAVMTGFEAGSPFMMSLDGRVVTAESDYFGGFMAELAHFLKTGEVAVPHEQTLSIMAVRGAAVEAMKRPFEFTAVSF
ncbi:MAG: hypothetical protein HFE45_09495 [Oscillospiraceae bacterium]|jgi:hypothetical protein|nr:hypothetical protein [Oscillospiraceae bacterium]